MNSDESTKMEVKMFTSPRFDLVLNRTEDLGKLVDILSVYEYS